VIGPLQRKKLRIRTTSEPHKTSYTTRDRVSVPEMRWPEHSADNLSSSVVLKVPGSVPTQPHTSTRRRSHLNTGIFLHSIH